MKKLILLLLPAFVLLLNFSSCFYDNGPELLGDYKCDTTSYTYSNDVKPIMENFCVSCHNISNANGAVRVDTYDNLKLIADDGRLVSVINHETGFPPMPDSQPKLAPCSIRLIELWVADGAPNN